MHRSSHKNEIMELSTGDMKVFQAQDPIEHKEDVMEKEIYTMLEKVTHDIVHAKTKQLLTEVSRDLKSIVKKLDTFLTE